MLYGSRKQIVSGDRLFVVSGPQRGAEIAIDGGPLRLGSDESCDILLLADEIGERRLDVELIEAGLLRIEPSGASVVAGGRSVPPGGSFGVGRNVPVLLGRTELAVSGSVSEYERSRRLQEKRRRQFSWAASLAIAIGIGASGAYALTAAGHDPIRSLGGLTHHSADNRTESVMPVLAAGAMRERLDAVGLSKMAVKPHRDANTVSVTGVLRQADGHKWDSVQRWFDSTYGATVYLETRISAAKESVTLPFVVESIWMGGEPRLTLHDGSRNHVGDTLPGGWTLDSIGNGSIEISRDGETLVLSL